MSVRTVIALLLSLVTSSSAQDPDLCSVVQPDIGPCNCQNKDGGMRIECDVDLLGLDTVGLAMDSQPCGHPVTGDIEITEKDIGIDFKVASLGAGTDDTIPIPGFSIGIPGTPLNAGVDIDIRIDGGPSDLSIDFGLNACVDIWIGKLCGSDIPGISGVLPVWAFKIQHIDFSSVCPSSPNTKVSVPTNEIAARVQLPVLSIGAWKSDDGSEPKGNTTAIVRNWLRQGGRGIDTALVHEDPAEVAHAIADLHISRKDAFITTMLPECADVQSCVNTVLEQLNTDYLDLLFIPSPFGLSFSDTWRVLEGNVKRGKIKSIGVINFNKKQLQEIWNAVTIKPAVNQITYNVFDHDEDTIAFCHAHNITIEANSPLGYHEGPWRKKSVFTEPIVTSIAKTHSISQAQVALKWIVQRGDTVAILSGNVVPAADADLWSFTFSGDEMTKLDSIASMNKLDSIASSDIVV